MTIESSNDHPHMSDTIDLHCRTTDQGEIRWSKLTGRFADNVQVYGHTLRIVSLRPENEGYYRCESSGYHGIHTKDYELVIIGMHKSISCFNLELLEINQINTVLLTFFLNIYKIFIQ